MEEIKTVEAVDPPRADDYQGLSYIYADIEIHNTLVSGNIDKYLDMVKEKQMNLYNIKRDQKIERPIEESVEIHNKNNNNKYKEKCIQSIFDGINRLEETLNRFKKLSNQ